jgi:hypothetical protein
LFERVKEAITKDRDMSTREYVINRLSNLTGKNTGYQFAVWMNSLENDFFVETEPATFEKDYAFLDLEIDLLDEFYQHYKNDSLSFITTDDLKELKHLREIWRSQPQASNWVGRDNCCKSDIHVIIVTAIESIEEYNYALAA